MAYCLSSMGATVCPSVSLSFRPGSTARTKSVSFNSSPCNGLNLHSSFNPISSISFSSSTLFQGRELSFGPGASPVQRRSFVVRAGKRFQLCQTKRNRSRKSLARTHGFRKRMSTTSGRATIRRRRAKGRWKLCTKTNPNSGKRA